MATRKKSKPAPKGKFASKSRAAAKKQMSKKPSGKAATEANARVAPKAKKSPPGVPEMADATVAEGDTIDEDALPLDILAEVESEESISLAAVTEATQDSDSIESEPIDDADEPDSAELDEGDEDEPVDSDETDPSDTAESSKLGKLASDIDEVETEYEPGEQDETGEGDEEPVSGPAISDPARLFDDSYGDESESGEQVPIEAVEGDLLDELGGAEDTGKLLRNAIEAMLFASDKPVTIKDIAKGLQLDKKRAQELLDELRAEFASHGIRIDEIADGYAFRTHPSVAAYVRIFLEQRPVKLSRAQLETLSIVAYRQPITRPEVDDIRGVDCGPVLKGLLERDLVRILGKKDEPGRPMLYGTTPTFLELFGLKSLQELPTLKEFAELSEDSKRKYEEEMGEGAPVGLSDFGLQSESDESLESAGGAEARSTSDPAQQSGSKLDTSDSSEENTDRVEAEQSLSPNEEDEKDVEAEDEEDDEDEDEEDEDEDEEDEDEEDEDEDEEDEEDEDEEDEDEDEDEDEEDEDEEDAEKDKADK